MKKYLSLLLLTVAAVLLTSCNDNDYEKEDALLSAQIPGHWVMTASTDNAQSTVSYRFSADGNFTYTTVSAYMASMTQKTVSIQGVWNIRKGVLQLHYELESLRCDGVSPLEEASLRQAFNEDNLLLADMNSSGKTYGSVVTFTTQNGVTWLELSAIDGRFYKMSF